MPKLTDHKSPLLAINPDGTCSITFYYQSPNPLLRPIVTLDSSDLYEWMIDKKTGAVKPFNEEEPIENPGLYSLRLENIPSGFASYCFKIEYKLELISSLNGEIYNAQDGVVYLSDNPKAYYVKGMDKAIFLPDEIDLENLKDKICDPGYYSQLKKEILAITTKEGHTALEEIIHDTANENLLSIHRLNLETKPGENIENVVNQMTSFIKSEDSTPPDWTEIQPASKIKGIVSYQKYGDKSASGTSRQERDVWIYKPEGFDSLSNKKVIFMLDGKDMCERLVPYIDQTETLSDTAIVFINPGTYQSQTPGRVLEYYYDPDFVDMLADELIPHYTQILGIIRNRDVILEAHSLAAYPMAAVANKIPDKIGGLILVSPALNQKKELFSENPKPEFKTIPISMQAGHLENAVPPTDFSDSSKDTYRELKPISRLASNEYTHASLLTEGYNVSQSLDIHPSGHDSLNVVSGTIQGISFIKKYWSEANIAHKDRPIGQFREIKSKLNEMQTKDTNSKDENIQKSFTSPSSFTRK